MARRAGIGLLVFSVLIILGIIVFYYPKLSAQGQDAIYVGIEKCKGCHQQQYNDFQARKFDKAWTVLEMRGKSKSPECLKCHTTGYGQASGFVSEEATPHLKYKQCEACHGPGSIHASNPADKANRDAMKAHVHRPNACTDCHKGVIAHRVGVEGL